MPIIGRIALGSLKNKLLILLPAALALSFLLPQAITPLLMLGGAYLCYEGAEKVYEALFPHDAHEHEAKLEPVALDAKTFEDQKIASAIKTDFILSAEIMAITLAAVPGGSRSGPGDRPRRRRHRHHGGGLRRRGADRQSGRCRPGAGAPAPARRVAAPLRAIGRGIVQAMPSAQRLGIIGTAAMIWVGGGIILHGLGGIRPWLARHALHDAGAAVARAVPFAAPMVAWLVEAAGAGVAGFGIGLLAIPLTSRVLSPLWRQVKSLIRRLLLRKRT